VREACSSEAHAVQSPLGWKKPALWLVYENNRRRGRPTVRQHIALLIIVATAFTGCVSTPGTIVAATPWGIGGVHSFKVQPEPVEHDRAAEAALHRRLQGENLDDAVVVASR
jgi:hypothetical protein